MADTATGSAVADRVYARVAWRLIPFLFLCYVCAYLDRVNVGFAKLQMQDALGFSDVVYGFGAGVFFLGYFIFEIPSNLLMLRYGASRCIARIMVLWGLISAAMMFITSAGEFYFLRFLLGVAEAGFFPGVIFYLTLWFPAGRRGRMTALFATAVAISTVIGAPLSGLILHYLDGLRGWAGWQWLFLIEGVPSIVMGVAALFYLDDRVEDATWLAPAERKMIADDLLAEASSIGHSSIRDGLLLRSVWLMAAIYFSLVMGLYGLNFWMPTIIQDLGYRSYIEIGFVNAVPFGAAAVAMVLVARSADRRDERRWHIIIPAGIGALGLVASVWLANQPILAIVALTVAACGIFAAIPQAWGLATRLLTGGAAAAGIALINSIGNLSGFVGPYAIGWIKQTTGSTAAGMLMLAASLLIGAALVLLIPPHAGVKQGRN
jgi:D-galactonate transporter